MISNLLAVGGLLSVLAPRVLPAQSSTNGALTARVDSLAAVYLAKLPTSSIAVAVIRAGDTLVMRAYGLADRDTGRSATPATVYEIGSLTKQFTAAAVMRLVERGKLRLDDDVSRYVPGFPLQGHGVTIRNLLSHTSGIHNYTAKTVWPAHWSEDLSPDSLVGFVARDTFDFAPGAQLRYSNTGYILLGMVIEKVTGHSYAAVLDEEFFKPLGLTRTRYCTKQPYETDFAKGYSVRSGAFVPAAYLSLTHPFAAGAVCSSVSDVARWEGLFHTGRVLRPSSYTLMTSPTRLTNGTRANYGFGLSIVKMTLADGTSLPTLMHNGGINGFLSQQIYLPSDSLIVVVLTNTDSSPPDGFAIDVLLAAREMTNHAPKR